MSNYYYAIAQLSSDQELRLRVVACVAAEGIGDGNPFGWAETNAWPLAIQPGWGAAYDAALKANNPRPGRDESVISDEMIHDGVQAVAGTASTPTPDAAAE